MNKEKPFAVPEIIKKNRVADYPIHPLILSRWSPRAMSGKKMDDKTLMSLFEAARWAPSSFNSQPWRFVYAKRETKEWDTLFNLLGDFNKQWVKNASIIIVLISRKNFEKNDKFSRTHSFDTGSSWNTLALQAASLGIIAHGMSGFDYERAKTELGVPDEYSVEAMIAIGFPGDLKELPEELRAKDIPSQRKKVSDIIMEGKFKE